MSTNFEDLIGRGDAASQPAAGVPGRLYFDTTNGKLTRDNGSTWDDVESTAAAGDVATDAIFDAKGDLAVGTGANTAAKLAAGANGLKLVADSGEATGLKWAASANLITNGTFDSVTTGWTMEGTGVISVETGSMKINRNGSGTVISAYQDVTVVSGRVYAVSIRVTTWSHGFQVQTVQSSTPTTHHSIAATTNEPAPQSVSFLVVATSTTIRLAIAPTANASATCNIDDVVMVEL